MAVPAATGPNTPTLALPPTLRLSLIVHAPFAHDPWFTSQTMPHINHSFCQAGHPDTVVDELTRALGLLAAHGVLQLTQSGCMESGTQQDGTGIQQATAFPFATDPTKVTLEPGQRSAKVLGQSESSPSSRKGHHSPSGTKRKYPTSASVAKLDGPVTRRTKATGTGPGVSGE